MLEMLFLSITCDHSSAFLSLKANKLEIPSHSPRYLHLVIDCLKSLHVVLLHQSAQES